MFKFFKIFTLWFKKCWYLFIIDYLLILFALIILIGCDVALSHPDNFPLLQQVMTIGKFSFTLEEFMIYFYFTIWIHIFFNIYIGICKIVFNAILKRKPIDD